MFGVVRARLTMAEVRRRERIAKRHGAEFVYAGSIPGSDVRGWFQCRNEGSPFNEATASAVLAEVTP